MKQIVFLLAILSVLCANAEGKGVVISVMGDKEPWPKEGVRQYEYFLECDYRHNFPGDPYWTYTYDMRCIQFEGETEKILSINYDNNVFDNYVVTSCEHDAIVNNIFPPKQKRGYTKEDGVDWIGRPTLSYIKYIKENGECYAREYQYQNRGSTAATRSTPEKIDCPGKPGWTKYGDTAQFTNCRIPKVPLSKIVKGWSAGTIEWTPDDEEGEKHEVLLECSFDQFSHLYNLKCVKGNNENEFFTFVKYKYRYRLLDRFTVSSCDEEGILYGIFPIKETTANPKDRTWVEKIWFSRDNGKCYKREYPYHSTEEPTEVDCPKATKPDEWINPSWGFAGQWRDCKGKMSTKERAKSQPQKEAEHDVSTAGHQQKEVIYEENTPTTEKHTETHTETDGKTKEGE